MINTCNTNKNYTIKRKVEIAQPVFTCSKLRMEATELFVKSVQC